MPRYSAEFKAQALDLLERNGGNVHGTAKQLGIGTTTLTKWAERAQAKAGRYANPEEEIRRLQKEIEKRRVPFLFPHPRVVEAIRRSGQL